MEKLKHSICFVKDTASRRMGRGVSYFSKCTKTFRYNLNTYFQSREHEEDLDTIINALYSNTNKFPDFELPDKFKERVNKKKKILLNQAAKLVGASILNGAWYALQEGNPGMVVEYSVIGAFGAVLIIVFTLSSVLIKRVLGDYEMDLLTRRMFHI